MDDSYLTLPKVRGLYITQYNIGSLFPKLDSYKVFMADNNIAIAAITETWLKPYIPTSLLAIKGYTFHRQDRTFISTNKDRGGGIGFYIRDDIITDAITHNYLNTSTPDYESFWLKCTPKNMKSMLIGCIYKPPIGNIKAFLEYMKNTLDDITQHNSLEIHLIGDVNVDFKDNKSKYVAQMKRSIAQAGLTQYIDSPTRITLESSTIIDMHATNCAFVADAGVFPLNLSDHSLTYLRKKKSPPLKRNDYFFLRSYTNFNTSDFKTAIQMHNWLETVSNSTSLEDAWKNIVATIEAIITPSCPIDRKSVV